MRNRREIPNQMQRDFEQNPLRRCVANGKVQVFWTPEDWAILTGPARQMYVQELKAAQEAARDARRYELIAINERTNAVTLLSPGPLTHAEACTIKSKHSPHPQRRIRLREYQPLSGDKRDAENMRIRMASAPNDGAYGPHAVKPVALACWGMSDEEFQEIHHARRPWARGIA